MAGDGLVVLCPGQGAQAVGMGMAWGERSSAARGVLETADEVVGRVRRELGGDRREPLIDRTLSSICTDGPPEVLNRTDVSQPAIFAVGVASAAGLAEQRGVGLAELPVLAAGGLSLGEYTALVLAGSISLEDGLRLVTLRGRAMQDAAEARPSGMVALIGADEGAARGVCEAALSKVQGDAGAQGDPEHVLVPANFNAPGQVVISGTVEACDAAEVVSAEMGIRSQRLPVAGAFHSPLMAPAAERLRAALVKTEVSKPRCQVVSNVTGAMHRWGDEEGDAPDAAAAELKGRLVEQLTHPVRWEANCRALVELAGGDGGATFLELAPGKTLAGLMRRIERGLRVESCDVPV